MIARGWLETADNPVPGEHAEMPSVDAPGPSSRHAATSLNSSQPRGRGVPRRSAGTMYRRGEKVVVQWRDEDGQRKTVSCPSKELAEQLLRKKLDRAFMIKHGLVSKQEFNIAERGRLAIAAAGDEFKLHLQARAKAGAISPAHAKEMHRQALSVADDAGIVAVSQIDEQLMGRMYREYVTAGKSPSTIRRYLAALEELRRFTMDGAKRKSDAAPQPKQISRVLEPKEVRALLAVADSARGKWRGDYYAVCLFMGIRWTEAARILWANVDFEKGILKLGKHQTKNKQPATIPIPPMVLDRLRRRQEIMRAVGRIPVFEHEPRLRTWKKDLKAAGITYIVADRYANRKCCRKTFTTWMAEAGVEDGTRIRLRRDVGGLMEHIYTDREREGLIAKMRKGLGQVAAWYEKKCKAEEAKAVQSAG